MRGSGRPPPAILMMVSKLGSPAMIEATRVHVNVQKSRVTVPFGSPARFLFLSLIVSFSSSGLAAQLAPSGTTPSELPRGEIIPRVACAETPEQTYALYLPSYFTPERAWPVIFALDPAARGTVPVDLAREAAEKFGFIVAGSNNSRNGPFTQSHQAAAAMAADVSRRFPIDGKRVYFTGFSGGARAAVVVALSCQGCAAGVFLHGAGFPSTQAPSKEVNFAVFTSVGTLDFNYSEVVPLQDKFEELQIPHHLRRFEGPHQWAPAEVWAEAMEWLDIMAMREDRLPRDDKFIKDSLSRRMIRTRETAASGDLYQVWQAYRDIARDFEGIADVSEAVAQASSLARQGEIQQGQEDEQREFNEERRMLGDFDRSFQRLLHQPAEYHRARGEIVVQLEELRKQRDTAQGWRSLAVRRAFSQVTARLYETGEEGRELKDYILAANLFELLCVALPENPGPYYQLGRTYALAGRKKDAVRSIGEAVSRGFNRPDLLHGEDFAVLANDSEFQQLVKAAAKKSGTPPQ